MTRARKMKIKIVNKLIIAFSIIILISASIGLFVSNRSIDENFDDYLKNKKHRKMLEQMAGTLWFFCLLLWK